MSERHRGSESLHRGMMATLDADNSTYTTRMPKSHVRMSIRNGRCSDAHSVEIEAQQKDDGTMEVSFVRINERTYSRTELAHVTIPGPGELWDYEQTETQNNTLDNESVESGVTKPHDWVYSCEVCGGDDPGTEIHNVLGT
jgi:hypothetical protein